jgi:acyl-CoA hydrolase
VSCIAETLTSRTQVTTGKNDVNYVVTEYGLAQLRARTARDRARALVAIAHPDFRAELTEAAARMHLV